ncbi:dimethylaniline monooxygenase [N-oxide-forming] 5-like isoform X1 [Sinocyclocheilus grahami]|uniref:Flavin-containing monooxygenase n=2 Tax=Sinocyclocheilus grahami TaxID=75366 RepID=A0A672Q0J0_SINGR|nr:PREDICTED: dimethylaniline monooxygenase [N-oxide-forming] 5-like isoform X1 [Sinocyclocheilus grahami]
MFPVHTHSMAKRVAVIGAGSSGLTSIKCCLDEGLEPVCFESSDDIGGLWNFKAQPEADRCSIYRSVIVNTSKEMMCYSDFPMPDHFPNFVNNSTIMQYFRLYAEHFSLLKHIHFQTTVRSVRQRPDFSNSGQWEVVTVDRGGREETHVFDGVLVCAGHYTQPIKPLSDFSGIDTFPGTIIHSWEYKDPDPYLGKRVVVVGIGNSGGDIAVDLSRACEKTFLSTRKGAWVIGRVVDRGLPLDMIMMTRARDLFYWLLPRALLNLIWERTLNQRHDHKLYGLQPVHRILDQRVVINDDLPGRILLGELVMKPNVQKFQGSTVVFDDGTVEEKIDAVILCTGYDYRFPFLPTSLSSGSDGDLKLYRRIFPPSLERPTLAILGLIQTKGPIMPAAELQARWATRVIAGLNHLPPAEKMDKTIEKHVQANLKSYPWPKVAALQVDHIPYLDAIAKEVGVCPNIAWLLLRDPAVGFRVFFGPCSPYQFRLNGPGHWSGARQAILTQWDRVAKPMKTRPIPEPSSFSLFFWLGLSGGAALIFALMAMRMIPLFLNSD